MKSIFLFFDVENGVTELVKVGGKYANNSFNEHFFLSISSFETLKTIVHLFQTSDNNITIERQWNEMKTSSPSNTSRGEKELMERKCIRWMMFSIEQNSQALSDARNTKNYIFVSKAKQSSG